MLEDHNELFRRELLKGSTEPLILSLLAEEEMYGYQLVREMEARSSGYFRLREGTLYPALHRLERDGHVIGIWEDSSNGQNRRYYHITPSGIKRLESMLQEWDLFSSAVNLVAHPVRVLAKGVLKG